MVCNKQQQNTPKIEAHLFPTEAEVRDEAMADQ